MTPSTTSLEKAFGAVWSPEQTADIAGWTVSRNGGFTRRLNSACAFGAASTTIRTRDAIIEWLAPGGGGRLAVRVTPLSHTPTMTDAVTSWGLAPVDETVVLSKPLGVSPPLPDEVELVPPDGPDFVEGLLALNGRPAEHASVWKAIVRRSDTVTGLWIPGRAAAMAGVANGICCVVSLAVAPPARRRGLASAVMDAAARWGHDQGARYMALQVVGTNTPALRLYGGRGFEAAYSYWYLEPRSNHGDDPR